MHDLGGGFLGQALLLSQPAEALGLGSQTSPLQSRRIGWRRGAGCGRQGAPDRS
jgi:hypothetical protein